MNVIQRKKKKRRLIAICVVLAIVLVIGAVLGVQMLSPDRALDLSPFEDALPAPVRPVAGGQLSLDGEGFRQVADNGVYVMELDPAEAMLRITEKASGQSWYSGYPVEEYDGDVIPRDRRIMRTLCSVSYTDFETVEETISSAADEVETTYTALRDGVEIGLNFPEQSIFLSLQFYLDETGLRVRVPRDKIREDGEYGIVQIDILPAFGAVLQGADGYIFYPDGCGALYDCRTGTGYDTITTQPIYGGQDYDFDATDKRSGNGQKTILLPCYGSAAGGRGFLAYMEEGSEYANLTFSPATEMFHLNRVYSTVVFRRIRLRTTPDDKEIYVTEKTAQQEDVCLKYLLLSGEQANYSGMAVALRRHLQETGRLPAEPVELEGVPLALEILLGTQEDNLYGKTGLAMTTYKQAQAMLEELEEGGVSSMRTVLLGWQKEGYGTNPLSVKTAGFLGSSGDLKNLLAKGDEIGSIYLQNDYVLARDGGSFSKQSDVAQSFLNQPITNAMETLFLLNPFKQYTRFTEDLPRYQKLGATGLAYDSVSDWLPSDNGKSRKLTQTDAKKLYVSMLETGREQGMETAVQKGADYTLAGASYLYNVYDDDSNLFAFTREIPFYQMVVHGVIPYSSAMPGNMSSDFTYQKLKWVEYGCLPYFLVSERPSNSLRDTPIDDVFSSRFADWKTIILDTAKEFESRLSVVAGETIRAHDTLSDTLVRVTYESGRCVYINYAATQAVYGDVTVPAMDYVVTEP